MSYIDCGAVRVAHIDGQAYLVDAANEIEIALPEAFPVSDPTFITWFLGQLDQTYQVGERLGGSRARGKVLEALGIPYSTTLWLEQLEDRVGRLEGE